jgi:hypothetical protein
LQEGDDDGGDSDSLFEFEIHDNDGNYATKLITQFPAFAEEEFFLFSQW